MFDGKGRDVLSWRASGNRTAIGLVRLIANPFQNLSEDFATVIVLSLAGLDTSIWLLSKGSVGAVYGLL